MILQHFFTTETNIKPPYLADFGLLVLIWMVQLVVYPGFKYYQRERLLEWHARYTSRISYIVGPLMLGQLCRPRW